MLLFIKLNRRNVTHVVNQQNLPNQPVGFHPSIFEAKATLSLSRHENYFLRNFQILMLLCVYIVLN